MFKSMTAYGRAIICNSLGRFVAELHSVNRKHLEINTFLPTEFLRYDADIKKWISQAVGRGQINVKIGGFYNQSSPLRISPNFALVRQYKAGWDAIANDLKLDVSDEAFFQVLASQKEIFSYEQEEWDPQVETLYREVLQELLMKALKQLKAMKEREGKILFEDISNRFAKLPLYLREVSKNAPGATQRYRKKLLDRISEIMGADVENEERILREISIYAEKIDIVEELTRFDAHISQVQELLYSEVEGVGKILEFLVQEMNREINTISSKSSDTDVSRFVIEIKSELERIREQIQNIE